MDKTNTQTPEIPKNEREIGQANADRYAEPEREMLYSLKSTIDRSGRYKFRLEDFSLGYAAAGGMSTRNAKREISEKFEKQFGIAPKQYLERSFEQNRANQRSNTRQNGQTKEKGLSREM